MVKKKVIKKISTSTKEYDQTLAGLKKLITEAQTKIGVICDAPRIKRKLASTAEGKIKLVRSLPKELAGFLPTVEEIEAELKNKKF